MPISQYRFYYSIEKFAAKLTNLILTQSREDLATAEKTDLCPPQKLLYQRLQQTGWTHQSVAIAYIGLTSAIALNISFGSKYRVITSIAVTAIALIAGEVIIHQQKLGANDGSTTTPKITPQ